MSKSGVVFRRQTFCPYRIKFFVVRSDKMSMFNNLDPELRRIDPDDCGCTDCMVGYSRPIAIASQVELRALFFCKLQNASGCRLAMDDHGVIYIDNSRPLPKRLDPDDCGCTDCLIGYSMPLNLATPEIKLAALVGTIRDATSGGAEYDLRRDAAEAARAAERENQYVSRW